MSAHIHGRAPAALVARLPDRSGDVGDGAADSAVLCLTGVPVDRADAVAQAWELLRLLALWRDAGRLPTRVLVLDLGAAVSADGSDVSADGEGDGRADGSAVRSALVDTLVRYVTGARFHEGPAVNCIRPVDADALPVAVDAVTAFLSGDLDAVRGQILVVRRPVGAPPGGSR